MIPESWKCRRSTKSIEGEENDNDLHILYIAREGGEIETKWIPAASTASPVTLSHYYICSASGDLEKVREDEVITPPLETIRSSSASLDDIEREVHCERSTNDNDSSESTGYDERCIIFELLAFARKRNWKKKVLTVLIVATSFLVMIDLIFFEHVRGWITSALEWMTMNPFGAVYSFIAFFVLATLLFIPPTILMFGAGYAFTNTLDGSLWYGFIISSIVSFIGCVLGAIAAFLRSRYMMRDLVELFSRRYPIVKALDRALERKGFRVMLLLRLCPIIPFNGLNHIGGIMNVSLENFIKSTVGLIPSVCLWCFCGASADRVMRESVHEEESHHLFWIVLLSSGAGFSVIATVLIWRFAIQELRKELDENKAETWYRYTNTTSNNLIGQQSESNDHPLGTANCTPQSERRRGLLAIFRIEKDYGIDSFFDGPENGQDEEWFWFWA